MTRIVFRVLENKADIEFFRDRFAGYVNVRLPDEYCAQSTFIAGFRGQEMVGGYMLVTKPAYRSLLFVPDEVKESHPFFKNSPFDMMEINGVWISASLKTAAEQFAIWRSLVVRSFLCRKQYVLLMANQKNINIRNIHAMTGASDIYQGPPMLMAGQKSHETIRVSYTSRWALLINLPRYYLEHKRREKRLVKKLKQRHARRATEVAVVGAGGDETKSSALAQSAHS